MIGASANSQPIDVFGRNCSLVSELEDVGQRLEQAERPDAVGAVAVLEAAEDLALGDEHDRDELQADREQHDRLDDLDVPGLVVVDGGEDAGHASTAALGLADAGGADHAGDVALEERAVPSGTASRTWTVASIASPPLGATVACMPSKSSRRWASAGDSRTRGRDARNLQRRRRRRPRGRPRSSGTCANCSSDAGRRAARAGGVSSPNGPKSTSLGYGRGGVALLPAHAAPAELVVGDAGVDRDVLCHAGRGHRAGEDAGIGAEALAELRERLPAGAHVARAADAGAQALQAAVGVRHRAVALGPGLAGKIDRRVLVRGPASGTSRARSPSSRAPARAPSRRGSSTFGSVCSR